MFFFLKKNDLLWIKMLFIISCIFKKKISFLQENNENIFFKIMLKFVEKLDFQNFSKGLLIKSP